MKKECINIGGNKSITLGNEYEIISETETRYTLLNDKGVQKNYSKNLFEDIVIAAPVIPVLDGFDVETSVTSQHGMVNFEIVIKLENNQDFVFGRYILNVTESNISCGIYTASGVDGLMSYMTNFKDDFESYLEQNKNLFTIDEDFDFEEAYQEISDSLIEDLINSLSKKFLFLLLSTNINNNGDYNELIINSLNQFSEEPLLGINPNSNNDITLWILKCN